MLAGPTDPQTVGPWPPRPGVAAPHRRGGAGRGRERRVIGSHWGH